MPTPAMFPDSKHASLCTSIAEQPKSTRQIVREEIKRAKDLEKLETQYKNGEISAFEYKAGKFLLNAPLITENSANTPGVCYSTTA